MYETIVVRRDLHVVQLTQCRELAALGETTEHRAIELQDLNCLFFQKGAAAIAREFALASRQGYASPLRQELQFATVVGPSDGFLEPARLEGFQQDDRFGRSFEV